MPLPTIKTRQYICIFSAPVTFAVSYLTPFSSFSVKYLYLDSYAYLLGNL